MTKRNSTVRFALVVQKCGRPRPVTLWTDPKKNTDFQRAIAQNRVLTIKQDTVGTKKDSGTVGFQEEPNASYWVFTKSLHLFEGKRVVGIRYDLFDDLEVKTRSVADKSQRSANRAQSKDVDRRQQFRIVLRCRSTVEITQDVAATNRKAAIEQARKMTKDVDFEKGTKSLQAIEVKRIGVVKT